MKFNKSKRYKFCPVCGDDATEYGGWKVIGWGTEGDPKIRCNKCNWIGYSFDLFDMEECKNTNRTKLIDRKLN